MDNKGRTYLFTFLILASVVVLIAAIGSTNAGKPQPVCGNGICEKGELKSCPQDCQVHTEVYDSMCQIYFSDHADNRLTKVNGNSGIASCCIRTSTGATNCYCDGNVLDWSDCATLKARNSQFDMWWNNHCNRSGGPTKVIDHIGCNLGTNGCGIGSKGLDCTAQPTGQPETVVVSPEQTLADNSTYLWYVNSSMVTQWGGDMDCGGIYVYSGGVHYYGKYANAPASCGGINALVQYTE